jgi:hypothetical protein
VKKTSFANDATLVARNTGIQIPESWKFLPHYFIKTKKLITSSERDSRTTSWQWFFRIKQPYIV